MVSSVLSVLSLRFTNVNSNAVSFYTVTHAASFALYRAHHLPLSDAQPRNRHSCQVRIPFQL